MNSLIDVIYQDDDIIVLNKPAELLSVPGRLPEHQDSLQLRVVQAWSSARVVHRLDMATSGIMLMALNRPAQVHISRQFEERKTQKSYIAHVAGQLDKAEGEVDLPLICDWPNRPKQKVDYEQGKPSLTQYRCLQQFEAFARVELTPVTGRSHQLRVHMMSIGHPILGDRFYAHEQALAMSPRLLLHATWLQITHPSQNTPIEFHSPSPF